MIAAVFDFDGTLVSVTVWQRLMRYQFRRGINRLPALAHLAVHYPMYPLARFGLMTETTFRGLWAEHMSWVLRGLTPARARTMFEALVAEDLLPSVRPAVLERLEWHRAQGHAIILLSGAFEPLLEVFAARVGIDEVAGNRLEIRDGRYTGRMLPPLCIGGGKEARLARHLADRGIDMDWQRSYAYADSNTDLPLLRRFGHPVAVAPDERLRQEAVSLGWAILEG